MLTNEVLLRSMRSSTGKSEGTIDTHVCRFGLSPYSPSTCSLTSPPVELSEAYVHALSTYEVILHDLIQYNAASLAKATMFDEDLITMMHTVAQERLETVTSKCSLGFLWALLGG